MCCTFPRLPSYIITYVISIFLSCVNTEAITEKSGLKNQNQTVPTPQKSTSTRNQERASGAGKDAVLVCFSADPRGLKEEHIPTLLPSFSP